MKPKIRKSLFQFLIIISIGILKIDTVKGQGYLPFIKDSTSWKVYVRYFRFIECEEEYIINYSFIGDTIYNGINYKVALGIPVFYAHQNGSFECARNYIGGGVFLLREDITNRKVFETRYGSNNEQLLYDFELGIGDTLFNSVLFNMCNYDIVNSIDSVLIDSIFHKRWNFSCISPVVEGLGSVDNPMEGEYNAFQVACFNYNGRTHYGYEYNNLGDTVHDQIICSFVNTIPKISTSIKNIQFIYDNNNRELIIKKEDEFDGNDKFTFQIIDLYGKILNRCSIEFNNEKIIKYKLAEISDGNYIIQLQNSKNQNETVKIITVF